jgi:hypothetical protein
MTMMKGTLHVALAAALLGLGATSAKAETPVAGPANNTIDLRVVNNNASMVRVYVVDASGKLHQLGRVSRSDFKILEIPGALIAKGDVQIKVFPDEPVWSLQGGADGIRTRSLSLKLGDAVNLFLETNLDQSVVEIAKG